jgi:hypothetical protein
MDCQRSGDSVAAERNDVKTDDGYCSSSGSDDDDRDAIAPIGLECEPDGAQCHFMFVKMKF